MRLALLLLAACTAVDEFEFEFDLGRDLCGSHQRRKDAAFCAECEALAEEHARHVALRRDREYDRRVAVRALARARAAFDSRAGLLVSMQETAADDVAANSRVPGAAHGSPPVEARAASVLRADLPMCPAQIGLVHPVGWAYAAATRDAHVALPATRGDCGCGWGDLTAGPNAHFCRCASRALLVVGACVISRDSGAAGVVPLCDDGVRARAVRCSFFLLLGSYNDSQVGPILDAARDGCERNWRGCNAKPASEPLPPERARSYLAYLQVWCERYGAQL